MVTQSVSPLKLAGQPVTEEIESALLVAAQRIMPNLDLPNLDLAAGTGDRPRRRDVAQVTRLAPAGFLRLVLQRPELVVCEDLGAGMLQALLYRAMRRRVRVVLWARQLPPHGALGRLLLRRADLVLVAGEANAEGVRHRARHEVRVLAVAEPLDLEPFAMLPERRSGAAAHRVLYVGALTPRAGVADFLAFAAAWAERNRERRLELWWAGDGDLRAVLDAQPLPPNLEQSFLPAPTLEELPQLLSECGLLAVSGSSEELFDTVLRAMAGGLPVIGNLRSQMVREAVVPGETGWTFDPRAPGSAVLALDAALAEPEAALDRMRVAARARALSHNADRVAERIGETVAWVPREQTSGASP
ncbi:glycosyltransferase [Roseomonas elaeocarpi]|uniref:Glycosyltransferase n=1 Tax=Roseomonas elaeocarpi TaxID=907779 RepID=A0ABV6JLP1_9PROT